MESASISTKPVGAVTLLEGAVTLLEGECALLERLVAVSEGAASTLLFRFA